MTSVRGAMILGLLLGTTGADRGEAIGASPNGLAAREVARRDVYVPPHTSGRVIVKFRDEVRARLLADGRLFSESGHDLTAIAQTLEATGARCRRCFDLRPEQLAAIESKAAMLSGRAQPDLEGFMFIGGDGDPLEVATILNGFDEVEFVELEPLWESDGPRGDPTGACCLPGSICVEDLTQAACEGPEYNGWYQGDGTGAGACGGCCMPDSTCQEMFPEACEDAGGTFQAFEYSGGCGFAAMCGGCCLEGTCAVQGVSEKMCDHTIGGSFMPTQVGGYSCVNLDGDDICGTLGGGLGSDAGDEQTAGSCFDDNGSINCDDAACCEPVCEMDPFCCGLDDEFPGRDGSGCWDVWCVDHAELICQGSNIDIVCAAATNDGCFTPHAGTGCIGGGCCLLVCEAMPTCCSLSWSEQCVSLALEVCTPAEDDPRDAPPDFRAAQGYLTGPSYLQEWGFVPPEMSTVIPLNTGDNTAFIDGFEGHGLDLQGLWELGELLVNAGISPHNLTRGLGTRVGVIDQSAFVPGAAGIHQNPDAFGADFEYGHFDLDVQVEADQTPIITGIGDLTGHHGTAVLGVIGAVDHDAQGNPESPGLSPLESFADETGCVGIASECDLHYFPSVSAQEPGGRLLSAIAASLAVFEPGDVLVIPLGPAGCGTVCSSPAEWVLLRLAADLGVACFVSAGNDCCNLDDAPQAAVEPARPDCDATIVGACYPGRPDGHSPFAFQSHCRMAFSNFCRGCDEVSACHTGGWGAVVTTLGYGNLYNAADNPNLLYTNSFTGTSAAAPMVGALAACLQGLSKMFFGIPITPEQLRGVVAGNGHMQCGYALANLDEMPGNSDPCPGDFNRDAPKNLIGGVANVSFPDALLAGNGLFQAGFFDDGDAFVGDVWVLRGEHQFGNRVSLQASDQAYLVVESEYTLAGTHPEDDDPFGLPFGAPASIQGAIADVTYIANGELTDVLIRSEETHAPSFGAIEIEVQRPAAFTALFVELYAWGGSGWTFIGYEPIHLLDGCDEANIDACVSFQLGSADQIARYLNPQTNEMLMRIWTFGFGAGNFGDGGNPENPYNIRYDEVRLTTGAGFGVTPNGG